MTWQSGYGPNLLVAHRCDDHRQLTPLNNAAVALVIYPREGTPSARVLGTGPGGEEIKAECGGCLADQVEGLYQMHLELMDTIAALLTSRAELGAELARFKRFL